jgi:hypothetical protein
MEMVQLYQFELTNVRKGKLYSERYDIAFHEHLMTKIEITRA